MQSLQYSPSPAGIDTPAVVHAQKCLDREHRLRLPTISIDIDGVLADPYSVDLNAEFAWEFASCLDPDDMDLLNTAMQSMQFVGYFTASRRCLNVAGSRLGCDPRVQTVNWLKLHGITEQQGVVSDCADRVSLLTSLGVDYHLTADAGELATLREAGIMAYWMRRGLSARSILPFTVSSVKEFLDRVICPTQVY